MSTKICMIISIRHVMTRGRETERRLLHAAHFRLQVCAEILELGLGGTIGRECPIQCFEYLATRSRRPAAALEDMSAVGFLPKMSGDVAALTKRSALHRRRC
jgi:hypothetical protein